MTETTPGRETIQIVEIRQPFCENVFGVAPCTATGDASTRCYNTRATCRDAPNFALGDPLRLFFARGHVAEQRVDGAPYIFPALLSVSTAPTRINLAGADLDSAGLGNRAVCSITIADFQHTDRRVDPYVDERPWDALDKSRGSFWTRWMRRNRYRQGVELRVYEGYFGQALGDMVMRRYFLDEISGPDGGQVTLRGKDILARLEERKAQAPLASPGRLSSGINSSVTTINTTNCGIADYAASGVIRINDEIMTYGARSAITGGVQFTSVTRGQFNTTARSHAADDTVQQCLRYVTARVDDILEDLLTTYGGVDPAWLDLAGWESEVDEHLSLVLLTTLITTPTPVADLVSQLQVQAQFNAWWDEREALVRLRAIRGLTAEPDLLTEERHILADSFSITEKPRERASQVWVYWGQQDYIKSITDPKSYGSASIFANIESETPELYGEASIRTIFGNWLPTGALADTTASKIITRFVDVPSECRFRLDAKDRAIWVGDTVRISHHMDVDDFGNRQVRNWTIISAEEVVPGEVVEYVAEDTTLYGRVSFIMANDAEDYPGAALAPFRSAYIGNSAGLLSDGAPCARIN
jgi:hypothetical protein